MNGEACPVVQIGDSVTQSGDFPDRFGEIKLKRQIWPLFLLFAECSVFCLVCVVVHLPWDPTHVSVVPVVPAMHAPRKWGNVKWSQMNKLSNDTSFSADDIVTTANTAKAQSPYTHRHKHIQYIQYTTHKKLGIWLSGWKFTMHLKCTMTFTGELNLTFYLWLHFGQIWDVNLASTVSHDRLWRIFTTFVLKKPLRANLAALFCASWSFLISFFLQH